MRCIRSASTDSASSSYSVVSSLAAIRTSLPAANSSATSSWWASVGAPGPQHGGHVGHGVGDGDERARREVLGLGLRIESLGDPGGPVTQPPQGEGQGGRAIGAEGYADAPAVADCRTP